MPVQTRAEHRAFMLLPWSLYKNDSNWVPPLITEQQKLFAPDHPFFEHASCRRWLALRGKHPVGRISAQIDQLYLRHHRDNAGFFGMIEAEDQQETYDLLFDAAESWLASQGMRRVMGPFNLSINQECGMLVEGFDTRPSMLMGHALPYMSMRVEQSGYRKEQDLIAFMIEADAPATPIRNVVLKKTAKRISTRTVNAKQFQQELRLAFAIYNDAWADNWGFVPFTDREIQQLGRDLKPVLNADFVRLASVDGKPAAFMAILPNINEAIADLNGRLLPLGWLKLLWRMTVRYPKSARMLLMGVRRQYQDSLLGAGLAYRLICDTQDAVLKRGIRQVELSWVLENNTGVRDIIREFGGVEYKRYRIFSKEI
ncbi:MAG: N-acetyltransferase [Desulfobulbaceae bacterium]|nr:N-acetyltransferase [Desulfobulbaceae bacterium]